MNPGVILLIGIFIGAALAFWVEWRTGVDDEKEKRARHEAQLQAIRHQEIVARAQLQRIARDTSRQMLETALREQERR